jgi:hypothetical protein
VNTVEKCGETTVVKLNFNIMEKAELFVCACKSLEHQIAFWYNEVEDNLYLYVHLVPERNIWKRLYNAVKYLFGYKSWSGEFDEFILDVGDIERLKVILDKMKYNEEHK